MTRREICLDNNKWKLKNLCSSRIILPYINSNLSSAKKVNTEIKKINDESYKFYKEEANRDETLWGEYKTNYEYYKYNNILSVVITIFSEGTDMVPDEYYTYVIDLKNDKLLTYDEVLLNVRSSVVTSSDYEINASNISNIEASALKYKTWLYFKQAGYKDDEKIDGKTSKEWAEICSTEYQKQDKKFYINNSGELFIIPKLATGAGMMDCAYYTPINLSEHSENELDIDEAYNK